MKELAFYRRRRVRCTLGVCVYGLVGWGRGKWFSFPGGVKCEVVDVELAEIWSIVYREGFVLRGYHSGCLRWVQLLL